MTYLKTYTVRGYMKYVKYIKDYNIYKAMENINLNSV